MSDSTRKVVKALIEAEVKSKVAAEIRELQDKEHAIKAARKVVYSAISRWIGEDVGVGDQIPILRNGEHVGVLHQTMLGGDITDGVTTASLTEHKAELERKKAAYQKVADKADEFIDALSSLSFSDRQALNERQASIPDSNHLQVRIADALGFVEASVIGSTNVGLAANAKVKKIDVELSRRGRGKGRPRNEAAHEVALELARLYTKITGKRPTYAEGPDGLSGEYTPVLREVFDCFGWNRTSLRGPATKAIQGVSDDDLTYVGMGLMSSFFSLPKK